MKKLIFINGTMGVGKSTVGRCLLRSLQPSVYLDGDWCWYMNPWVVNDENKAMVVGNILHLLRAYLRNSGFKYVIFTWVMHQPEILKSLLSALAGEDFTPHIFTLICSEDALRARLQRDVDAGLRQPDSIPRSLERLPLYRAMDTEKIDVSDLSPEEAAEIIRARVAG